MESCIRERLFQCTSSQYHGGMVVNGMLVETLDPENIVAHLYKSKEQLPTRIYNGLVNELNRQTKNNNQLIGVN